MAIASLSSCWIATGCNSLSLTAWGYTNDYSINTDWQVPSSHHQHVPVSFERGGASSDSQSDGGVEIPYPATAKCHYPLLHNSQVTVSIPWVQSCCLVLLISVHDLQWFYELSGGNDEAWSWRTSATNTGLLVWSLVVMNQEWESSATLKWRTSLQDWF